MDFETQTRLLNTPPDIDLITPPDKYIQAPYLSGEVIIHYLNEIFGPAGWGYSLIDWPELVPLQEGKSGVYKCRGRVWFAFDGHDVVERLVPGFCAVRPKSGKILDAVGFEQRRMGYQGAITDMIKGAASSLGVRLGLGLNDQLLRRKLKLGSAYQPQSPAKDEEELFGPGNGKKQTKKAQPQRKSNGAANAWILDNKARAGFWAGVREKGLTHDFVHEALNVKSLKDYEKSVSDAWIEINAAVGAAMAKQTVKAEDTVVSEQQAIPF